MHENKFTYYGTKVVVTFFAITAAMLVANFAYANDNISTAVYQDNNNDGQVDRAVLTMDEAVLVCTYEAGDWSVDTAGDLSVSITGISCSGNDLIVNLNADANETGATIPPVISYTNQGTLGSVQLASGNMSTHAGVALGDNAKPVVISADLDVDTYSTQYESNALKLTYSEVVKVYGDGLGGNELSADAEQESNGNIGSMTVARQILSIGSWSGSGNLVANSTAGTSIYHTADGRGVELRFNGRSASHFYSIGNVAPSAGDVFTPFQNASAIADATGNPVNSSGTVALTQTKAWDASRPSISNVYSCDLDEDGDVETIILQLDETMADASLDVNDFEADIDATNDGNEEVPSTYDTNTSLCEDIAATSTANDSWVQLNLTTGIATTDTMRLHLTSPGFRDTHGMLLSTFTGRVVTDKAPPQDLTSLTAGAKTDTSIVLNWTAVSTETGFGHYEIWFGEDQSDVEARGGTATEWDNSDDANLTTRTTGTTTINSGLDMTKVNYFKIWAFDDNGYDSTISTITSDNISHGGNYVCPSMAGIDVSVPSSTTSDSVTVSMSVPTDVNKVIISEDINYLDASWQSVEDGIVFNLSEGEGDKTIYVLFKNACGSTSAFALTTTRLAVNDEVVDDADNESDSSDSQEEFTDDAIINPENVEVNRLVRSVSSPAVYFLGEDGKRHVFSSERIFFSWYNDFSDVQIVSDSLMASYKIGSRMHLAPGSLIKIQSDPKVYLVDSDGSKRHIADEDAAVALFGADWNTMIVDIDVTEYNDYPMGMQLTVADAPYMVEKPEYPF